MIELIVLDVDGCLTDGSIVYTQNGDEIKSFNVKDGLAISSWMRLGKKAAIITGRNSKIVQRRARELRVEYLYQGIENKKEKLEEVLKHSGLKMSQVAVIGDDLNDYAMLKKAGLSFAPKDACEDVKKIVDCVLKKKGGKGAVRKMIEIVIKECGLEREFLEQWY